MGVGGEKEEEIEAKSSHGSSVAAAAAPGIYQEHSRRPGNTEAKRETTGRFIIIFCIYLIASPHERTSPIQSNTLSHTVTLGFIEQTNE